MKTKAKSVQVFELRLWSKKHFNSKDKNIYDGTIVDSKTKKRIHFHDAADLLLAIKKMYKEDEKKE